MMIANISQYARTFRIAPGAEPDDGLLHVVLVKPMGAPKAFIAAMSMQLGQHRRFRQVSTFTCREVEVELMDDMYSQEDGEVYFYPEGTKFHISLDPQVLDVVTPSKAGSRY
jgi:diacylglycerol kinase family enzyme